MCNYFRWGRWHDYNASVIAYHKANSTCAGRSMALMCAGVISRQCNEQRQSFAFWLRAVQYRPYRPTWISKAHLNLTNKSGLLSACASKDTSALTQVLPMERLWCKSDIYACRDEVATIPNVSIFFTRGRVKINATKTWPYRDPTMFRCSRNAFAARSVQKSLPAVVFTSVRLAKVYTFRT